jgi:MFS family permease
VLCGGSDVSSSLPFCFTVGKGEYALSRNSSRSPLLRSLVLITLGGCLAMVYTAGTNCPAQTQFFLTLGANELHLGLLGGIPMIALIMQFPAVVISNHIRYRKKLFMTLFILSRLFFVPVVTVPLLIPSFRGNAMLMALLLLIAVSYSLTNIAVPLWFSWMADLIPTRVLNTYWGTRQRWMQLSWTAAYLAIWAFTFFAVLPIKTTFAAIIGVAVIAGVVDILLFIRVHEPPNTISPHMSVTGMLLAPLRHSEYKTFVLYSCAWLASVMFAAAFMQPYALKHLGLSLSQATLIWCLSGVGNALAARRWGRIADRHGHKPIIIICTLFKPLIVLTFLLVTDRTAMWVLPVVFLADGALNAGNFVSSNGYMLKIAPRENRSAFVAAILALAGICGGLSAILAGVFLTSVSGFSFSLFGRTWMNYHLLFVVSFFMRIGCAILIHWVREPRTSHPARAFADFCGNWPIRLMRFPIRSEEE